MSKPVEVEKVGADSPMEGAGKRDLQPFKRTWFDLGCRMQRTGNYKRLLWLITFSSPPHADLERNGSELNHQVCVSVVIIKMISHYYFHLSANVILRLNVRNKMSNSLERHTDEWYLCVIFLKAQSMKVGSFPLSPNLSSSKVSLPWCLPERWVSCLCMSVHESGSVFVHLLCPNVTL